MAAQDYIGVDTQPMDASDEAAARAELLAAGPLSVDSGNNILGDGGSGGRKCHHRRAPLLLGLFSLAGAAGTFGVRAMRARFATAEGSRARSQDESDQLPLVQKATVNPAIGRFSSPEVLGLMNSRHDAPHRSLSRQAYHGPVCRGFEVCPEYPQPYANGEWPTEYSIKGDFPDDFVWGLATAAYQIEGGYRAGGRGASIWDTFTGADTLGMPGANCSYCCKKAPCKPHRLMLAKGATGSVACDHYHQWKADVALMKSMGLRHYRFSISWPRLFPTGASSGEPNPEGVAFYNNLIDELLVAGITPFVTLYHWDLPQALLDPPRVNGWWSRDKDGKPNGEIMPAWIHYVDTCFTLFGDRVKTWTTFNEAWTFVFLASGYGKAPSLPEFSDMSRDPWIAGHNVLNAHAAAVQLYRAKFYMQGGQIGITNNQDWREPSTTDPEDVAATERSLEFQLGWFSEPIFGGMGDYPKAMREMYGDRLPKFTEEERRKINGSADFFGLNHYGTGLGAFTPEEQWDDMSYMRSLHGPTFVQGQSSWLYAAGWGFRKLLNWVSRRYGKDLPIYITEGGWSMAANATADGISDRQRLDYYANYTSEMRRAIAEDGVNVKAYFAWSLMDNFEWEQGFAERFGTTYNDFAGKPDQSGRPSDEEPSEGRQVRTRKQSSCWLEAVWRSNELVDPDRFHGCVSPDVFTGQYLLPGEPDCRMEINVGPLPEMAYIRGVRRLDGTTGRCSKVSNVSWGPTPANLSGGTIIADFSIQGLSSNLAGYWNREDRAIHWGDGGVWKATAPVKVPAPHWVVHPSETIHDKDKGGAACIAPPHLLALATLLVALAGGLMAPAA